MFFDDGLGWPLLLLLAIWVALWVVSKLMELLLNVWWKRYK